MFYTYVYVDPRKPGKYMYSGLYLCFLFEPFYVGKGSKNRLYDHLTNYNLEKNNYKNNKIKKLKKYGYNLKNWIVICNKTEDSELAFRMEEYLCRKIGIFADKTGPLTNQSYGGLGGKQRIISKEERENRSKNHWMKYKTYNELYGEERAKLIRFKRSVSLKNHECYRSPSRSTKLSQKAKGKVTVYDIQKGAYVNIPKNEFNFNIRYLSKSDKNKFILFETINENKKIYFRSIPHLVNYFGFGRTFLFRVLVQGIYRYPKRGSKLKYKKFDGLQIKQLKEIPHDFEKYAYRGF